MSRAGFSVSQFFGQDHDRLDGLWAAAQALQARDVAQARVSFQAFQQGLERHIRWEEALLFPLFEEKTGLREGGPTAVMRHEHGEIRRLLGAIDARLRQGQPAEPSLVQALHAVLTPHNYKEEQVLYPLIDQQLTGAEQECVFQQIRHDTEASASTCCGGA